MQTYARAHISKNARLFISALRLIVVAADALPAI